MASLLKKMGKREELKTLIEELDTVFSIFIRTRHADENGMVGCFTCGKINHWSKMQCGHYWSRRYYSTRWDELNCEVQDFACNVKHEGNKPAFTVNLIKKHGPEILSKLEIAKNRTFKLDKGTLLILIEYYTNLNKKRGVI